MRGEVDPQSGLFGYFSPEKRVPADHPLRSIKRSADSALKEIRPLLDELYSEIGRPSIPPERLLKAQLLIAPYSVRFCDEHFSVDGTLIEAWASMKSFRRKDGGGSPPDGGGERDFHGERRTNETHASTTDPEAKLFRKAAGQESKRCFAGHALMDNRHGLITDVALSQAVGATEAEEAVERLVRQPRKHVKPQSVGADKGYHNPWFVTELRSRAIRPHVACIEGRASEGVDGRTRKSPAYRASQVMRKRIEPLFGWGKAVGGLRKTRLRGVERNGPLPYLTATAYNLLRIRRLCPATRLSVSGEPP